ncbi:MAG: glycosyltransferase family 2 protein [Clostridia bacterium]|nr:glycosyltransferase family 2 protein [Clostridia bacterium]
MDKIIDAIAHVMMPQLAGAYLNPVENVGYYISNIIGALVLIFYSYQFFYIFLAMIRKPRKYKETDQTKRYGVIIAARNEEKVLPELLKSIAAQTYPSDRVDVFVIADNCEDRTADVAREMGAHVYERNCKAQIGKGYALRFLFNRIKADGIFQNYDAYMIFDADNVLTANYIEEMDKAYCAGHRVVTSFRNSKNYGKNWISSGYALWFMRESTHLNNPRSILGTSSFISGTGFMVDREIIERNNGWKHFLLTEDIEFTADCILHGDHVGYCHDAEFFDEQPESFRQSWWQRKRWAKGLFQVFRYYGTGLLKGVFKLDWSCFDMTMNIMPAFILSAVQCLSTAVLLILNLIIYQTFSTTLVICLTQFLLFGYILFFILGLLIFIAEWKRIRCNKFKAILLLFTFPLFMLTYIPVSFSAFLSRSVTWKPVEHNRAMGIDELSDDAEQADEARTSTDEVNTK